MEHHQRRSGAFTLVELLVVILVIGILVTAVLAISTTLINKAKTQNTRAVLGIVRTAIEEFSHEQAEQATLTSAPQASPSPPPTLVRYVDRYGNFPPDELEVFTPGGLPTSVAGAGSLAVGGATMVPPPTNPDDPYDEPMKFYDDGRTPEERALEHRDLAALIVGIELYSEPASVILAGIPGRNWVAGPFDTGSGQPLQFLDRPDPGWDPDDFQIRYIVDDWGIPISYLAQRDYDAAVPPPSPNHADWNQASTEMIRLNAGQPIIMSYGPDGKDQLTLEAMSATDGEASLVADWMDEDPDPHRINHRLNMDNVYADPALTEKLAKGLAP